MSSANQIRRTFLDFFKGRGHAEIASGPLVPQNDPTLMFTNSGMVQFKNVFTGQETRPYKRATTSQKCVRAGGKHNDLENVGKTARHHTFFEMLGNFSFGDYFKAEAIESAWTLVTHVYGLPKDKLLVTVFHNDEEAKRLWKKVAGLSEDRIIPIATSDNFWTMGDTGPCGPCSEIFYDHGPEIWGGPPGSPEEGGDRFIEIWNLVFMQFDVATRGAEQLPLPKPSIDTGLGLERLAAVLQGKHDNYDIDLMRTLIEASAQASQDEPDGPNRVSHRVIADHLRAAAFLIAEGVLPSNEGRGYVLRRIMRRGMRHAHLVGNHDPLLHRLVPTVVAQMGEHFGELRTAEALIAQTLALEETRFKATLDRGLRLLSDAINKLGGGQDLPGSVAFRLYDTFGFPMDLTQDILRDQGRGLDTAGFELAMAAQKEQARRAHKGVGGQTTEAIYFDLAERLEPTEFLGYNTLNAQALVTALINDGVAVAKIEAGENGILLASQTPFYAESGGQQGDQGRIEDEEGNRARVIDTQKQPGGLWLHVIEVEQGRFSVGQTISLTVDQARRTGLRQHHSATHLLHAALRQALGAHVAQRGSLVAPDRLRFDFAHACALDKAELRRVEDAVNAQIQTNRPVTTRLMALEDAKAEGAIALFGEKYGEEVRVVTMGTRDEDGKAYSIELCGGTHVSQTGEIGQLVLLGEEGLSAGVRRITALTGQAALAQGRRREELLEDLASQLKAPAAELPSRLENLLEEGKKLKAEISKLRKKLAAGGGGTKAQMLGGVPYSGQILGGIPARDLKGLADTVMGTLGEGIAALISIESGKASIVVTVAPSLTPRISAVDLVRVASAALGGKGGGGRPDMAQAGGPDASAAATALNALEAKAKEALGAGAA